jgi:hypothetical protein
MENQKSKKWMAILGLAILVLLGWFAKIKFIDQPTLITVIGEGKVNTQPEMVKFTVNLSNTADSALVALTENNRLKSDTISMIKNAGVNEKDIVVSYVRIIPSATTLNINYYQAINAIDVALSDLSKFDNLVSGLYSIGIRSVSNIVFTTQNSETLEKEAIGRAITNAQLRAKEMAKSVGKKVGRMVSIQATETGEAGALSGLTPSQKEIEGPSLASPSQIEIVRQALVVFELR